MRFLFPQLYTVCWQPSILLKMRLFCNWQRRKETKWKPCPQFDVSRGSTSDTGPEKNDNFPNKTLFSSYLQLPNAVRVLCCRLDLITCCQRVCVRRKSLHCVPPYTHTHTLCHSALHLWRNFLRKHARNSVLNTTYNASSQDLNFTLVPWQPDLDSSALWLSN